MDSCMNHNSHFQSKLAKFHLLFICFFALLLQSSPRGLVNCSPIKFNNDYIKKLYNLKNLNDEQKFSLVNNEASSSLSELSDALTSKQVRYVKLIELTNLSLLLNQSNLIELFFPYEKYGNINQLEHTIKNQTLDMKKFNLQFLNLSSNSLRDHFLEGFSVYDQKSIVYSTVYGILLVEYFSHVRMLHLGSNQFHHLEHKHFEIFCGSDEKPSQLETIVLKSNTITSIRHDTFNSLIMLKYVDLSFNKIKLIHPLTFGFQALSLNLLDLSNNNLKALFETSHLNTNQTVMSNLEYLYLNKNDEIVCDCGLMWLYDLKQRNSNLELDEFKCDHKESGMLNFDSISDASTLNASCQEVQPSLHLNNKRLEETSHIPLFRMLSKRWFAWTVFHDHLPTTTPYPYLMDGYENTEEEKHVFHAWRLKDMVLECSNLDPANNDTDNTKSTIIWKTQYGYFGNVDTDLMVSLRDDCNPANNTTIFNSFKAFYKMNKLTKITKNLSVVIGKYFGAETKSDFYVNNKSQLIVTNFRQPLAGPYTCISINENGIKMFEYDMRVRTAMNEYFIYSLFVSLVSMIVPSILGMFICCYCEYEADKNYPMTPACYPTPMANTPPNFDFNEWMANAAKYLPNVNLNIHDTLEQVNKKLRKGVEKATVTVKSLGLTSHAYLNSMYEQSTQRWSDIKGYRPSINMPTINLPSMKYPPVGQLANRMRMGVGNMLLQMREFCGSNDLTQTRSFNDLDTDTNAFNQIGSTFINIDQFDMEQNNTKPKSSGHHHQGHSRLNSQYHNFYRFLHLMREARQREARNGHQISESESTTPEAAQEDLIESAILNEIKPSTSIQASLNGLVTMPSTSASSSSSSRDDAQKVYFSPKSECNSENDSQTDSDEDNNAENSSPKKISFMQNADSNPKLKPDDDLINSKRTSSIFPSIVKKMSE